MPSKPSNKKSLKKLFKEIEQLFCEADKLDELTEDVYHYTTKEALIKILESRKFFISNLKDKKIYHTNELHYGLESLKNLVPKQNLPIPYEEIGLTNSWQGLEWYLENKIKCFQLSFCLNRDDSDMWENFCKNKEDAVAIRISKEYFALSKAVNELSSNLVRTKIFYENSKSEVGYLDKLSYIIKEILDNLTKENQSDTLVKLYSYILAWLPKFLRPTYISQREYRVYVLYDNTCKTPPNIEQLNGKNGIFCPQEMQYEYIKEIILGPSCIYTEETMRSELKEKFPNGEFDHIEINRSQVTLD